MKAVANLICVAVIVVAIVLSAYYGTRWAIAVSRHSQSMAEYWAIEDHGSAEGKAAYRKTCEMYSKTGELYIPLTLSLVVGLLGAVSGHVVNNQRM